MKENSNIFERIIQIIEYYNINSVNSFAKEYLGYASSEKINRLKDSNKRPSVEILEDISNKFENINPEWLLLGKGEMLRNSSNINSGNGQQIIATYNSGSINADNRQYYSDSPDVLRAQIDLLDERIKEKDAQIKEKDAQISRLMGIIEKMGDK